MSESNQSRYEKLMSRLEAGAKVMIDGGTGTEVERRGVPQLDNAWNGGGTLSHPDVVRAIHEDYISHGAEVVISNTFATSLNTLEDAGVPEQFEDYNRRAVELVCEARDATGKHQVLVAGGISGWSFTDRIPSLEQLESGVSDQAAIMARAGADLIMLEMMVEVPAMLAILNGVKKSGLPVWVGLSCAPDANGVMCLQTRDTDESGVVQGNAAQPLVDALQHINPEETPLVNIMHTDVEHVSDCLDIIEQRWSGLIGVYAHSGQFVANKWIFDGTITPQDYATASQSWLNRKVSIVGGCCGIRPEHMAELARVSFS